MNAGVRSHDDMPHMIRLIIGAVMLSSLVSRAESESEWIWHSHTTLQFQVSTPATWKRFEPSKNANSPMGDLEITSADSPRVTFDLSVERQGRRFDDMARMMDATTGAYQTNGMIVRLARSAGTNDCGKDWVIYDTLTIESGQTNRISMIIVDGGEKPTLIGTAFIREELNKKSEELVRRIMLSIRHSGPNKGLLRTGDPRPVRQSAEP